MITQAMHEVVIKSELYISYVNFKTLHAAGNASLNYWSRTEWVNESVIEFLNFSSLLSYLHLLLLRVGGGG